ncbi:MAG TPA: YitT family protein [Anaerolineaceae bacterium]|nr:YitT family protein [Anaerolineaceae bacterium]
MASKAGSHPSVSRLSRRFQIDPSEFQFSWKKLQDYAFILIGALVQALAMRLFLVPAQLVSGGISGAAQIINYFSGWPIGVMVFIGNAPLFILGWRFLGGSRFALRTALAIVAFSAFTDLLVAFIPAEGFTDDLVLNALYGGILLGVGLGLVYRGRGTSGGSDILGRILNHRLGISISQAYLITDTLVVLAGGLAFDWERALYGLVVIYVSGLAAEMTSEGQSIFRTAIIVTNCPDAVSNSIFDVLERGVTILPGTGAYTGASRPVLYCVVTRSEVNPLKEIVRSADPKAFMVIGSAHEALGEGFLPLNDR